MIDQGTLLRITIISYRMSITCYTYIKPESLIAELKRAAVFFSQLFEM